MQGRLPYQNVDLAASSQLQSLIHEVSDVEWSAANRYYFKSIASVQLLRQICLNFHKDFTLEQVDALNYILVDTTICLIVLHAINKILTWLVSHHTGLLSS